MKNLKLILAVLAVMIFCQSPVLAQVNGGGGSTAVTGSQSSPIGSFNGVNGSELNVALEPAQIFWDDFGTGTLDITNRWTSPTTGGGGNATAATNAVGNTIMGSGTTASGWSILQSQYSFPGRNPGYVTFAENNGIEFPVLTNAYRFFGFATIPGSPTAALPLTNAVGFSIDINGKWAAVTWASGAKNFSADLSAFAPQTTGTHFYEIKFRGDNILWFIDHVQVATLVRGQDGPDVNTLPLAHLAVANTSGPSSSATIQLNGVTVGDSSRNTNSINDSTYKWRQATVKAASAAPVATDGALVVASSPYLYNHISTSTNTVVKSGVGVIHTLTVNNLGTVASTTTVFDNTAASGTVIAVINTLVGQISYVYDVGFNTGLTIATTGTVAPDVTVSYK